MARLPNNNSNSQIAVDRTIIVVISICLRDSSHSNCSVDTTNNPFIPTTCTTTLFLFHSVGQFAVPTSFISSCNFYMSYFDDGEIIVYINKYLINYYCAFSFTPFSRCIMKGRKLQLSKFHFCLQIRQASCLSPNSDLLLPFSNSISSSFLIPTHLVGPHAMSMTHSQTV